METKHADPAPNHDDPLAGPTYLIGFVGLVLLVAIVVLLQVVVYDSREDVQAAMQAADPLEIREIRAQHRGELEGYGWSYPEEDRVRIPIGEGVEQVLERYGTGAGQ